MDLASPEAATSAIGTLNGTVIPGTDKTFKLNWASGGNPASGYAVVDLILLIKSADFFVSYNSTFSLLVSNM